MPSTSSLKSLFDPTKINILSDSLEFLFELRKNGYETSNLLSLERLPTNSIVFSFTDNAAKHAFEIAKETDRKKCIFCATHVFEPSIYAASYSLNLLLNSDFIGALRAQEKLLSLLDNCSELLISGPHTSGKLRIRADSIPYAMIEEDVRENFIHSVAEFFEVHYAHMNPEKACPFNFEGKIEISGILTVLRKSPASLSKHLKPALHRLAQEIAKKKATLTVTNNKISSLLIGSTEYKTLLEEAAGARGLFLTEFAIGVNSSLAPIIDYSINSQLNEGIAGIHVAIGDGSTGYHIDFLSPNATVAAA
ncbi:hypothetical protein NVV94_01735 [Pseudomonas sp. LS1212]|uniref:hypothetical protein n=1 Tax=Pseudomonas sp. LS1212 TaxID=2972478 RepID=UPI00215C6483|nr:hypothetical protein [Pseudomonas sp. LS1212]UVJ44358.1 hypothetical protein NVV94_01735 [Pseudomonas sp. LS1212]